MIIISGCPRSGTSVMMDIMRSACGDDKLIGSKFPNQPPENKRDIDVSKLRPIRQRLIEKHKPDLERRQAKTKDMNPHGFWECQYSVQGIQYNFVKREEQDDLLENGKDKICKIVSQGLIDSDPRFIDKVVFMMRHPRAVAKSQERLTRQIGDESLKVHTPEMFIQVTAQAARWRLAYPDIPFIVIHYEDVISDPNAVQGKLQTFIGTGDFKRGMTVVDPNLQRSKHEDINHELWEDAEYIHENFCAGDYENVVKRIADPDSNTRKANRKWLCFRLNSMVVEAQCKVCLSNPVVAANFRKTAESSKIDWKSEPCAFECGIRHEDKEFKAIEDSIKDNHWDVEVKSK